MGFEPTFVFIKQVIDQFCHTYVKQIKTNCDVSISLITNNTLNIKLIKEMGYMSNFKIAFFTKVKYEENFRDNRSKQYIKGAYH